MYLDVKKPSFADLGEPDWEGQARPRSPSAAKVRSSLCFFVLGIVAASVFWVVALPRRSAHCSAEPKLAELDSSTMVLHSSSAQHAPGAAAAGSVAEPIDDDSVAIVAVASNQPELQSLINPVGPLPGAHPFSCFSIVIASLDEAMLGRTVTSLLNHIGQELVNEVLIIDDAGKVPVTYDSLPNDPRVHIVRSPTRLGLIRARDAGAQLARGPYLVFIDGHCKPRSLWLDSVRALLDSNHRRLVNFQVGMLNATSWTTTSPERVGSKAGFSWSLDHFWQADLTPEQTRKLAGPDADVRPDISPSTPVNVPVTTSALPPFPSLSHRCYVCATWLMHRFIRPCCSFLPFLSRPARCVAFLL